MNKKHVLVVICLFCLYLSACGKPIDRTVTFHEKVGLDFVVHVTQDDDTLIFEGILRNNSKKNLDLLYGDTSTLRIKTKDGLTPYSVLYRARSTTLKPNEEMRTNTVTIPYDKKMKNVDAILEIMVDEKIYETSHKMTLDEK